MAFLELHKFVSQFREEGFNGEALAGASDQDLQDLGMKIRANRTRLLNRVKDFLANGVPPAAIGRCPEP